MTEQPAIELRELEVGYDPGQPILRIPKLEIAAGERVFLYGPSGCGKTTLLGVLAGVLPATHGEVWVLGRPLHQWTAAQRDAFRGEHVGYIFQMFNLLPYLDVRENILLSCRLNMARRARLGSRSLDTALEQLAEALEISDKLDRRPIELSTGEQQRVAAARALLGAPALVIADEPTSALDADRCGLFLELLLKCCAESRATLVFVSHDRQLEPYFDRALDLTQLTAAEQEAG